METNTLERVLTETIIEGKQAVGTAVNWALEQAPDVCDQYLAYSFIHAVWWASFCLLIIFFFTVIAGVTSWMLKKNTSDGFHYVPWIFWVVLLIIPSIEFGRNSLEAMKIKVAPKVYLVEFASKLVKR